MSETVSKVEKCNNPEFSAGKSVNLMICASLPMICHELLLPLAVVIINATRAIHVQTQVIKYFQTFTNLNLDLIIKINCNHYLEVRCIEFQTDLRNTFARFVPG
jgi:hypothetical protein